MPYKDERPLDANLRALVGKPETDAVTWWKSRFEQIAAIPLVTARAGALIPEWRELAAMPRAQRIALTRARVLASEQLAQEQRERIFEARAVAAQLAPSVHQEDLTVLREEVVPTLPPEVAERVRTALQRDATEQRP